MISSPFRPVLPRHPVLRVWWHKPKRTWFARCEVWGVTARGSTAASAEACLEQGLLEWLRARKGAGVKVHAGEA